jgi:hypothetical protein
MKFHGVIGYAGETVEIHPGVWEDRIVEKEKYGDVIRNSRQLQDGTKVNDDLTVSNSISIVADAYDNLNFFQIRYIRWAGTLWQVRNVTVQSPRLLLELGGVYHGEVAAGTATSS